MAWCESPTGFDKAVFERDPGPPLWLLTKDTASEGFGFRKES
jgi:hypothetical protein